MPIPLLRCFVLVLDSVLDGFRCDQFDLLQGSQCSGMDLHTLFGCVLFLGAALILCFKIMFYGICHTYVKHGQYGDPGTPRWKTLFPALSTI